MQKKIRKLAISAIAALVSALTMSAQEASTCLATYTYLDDGTKLSVSTPDGKGHVYRGSFVYDQTGTVLQYVILPDGMFEKVESEGTGNSPEFRSLWFVKDQVGSVVSVIDITDSDASADDAVVMKTGYLPFGSEWQNANFVSDASMRYRFNGKETQPWTAGSSAPGTLSSLPHLLDYGARSYDPLTCSWTTPDPLAHKYLSWSPYTFCAGNPVNFVDYYGEDHFYFTDGIFVRQMTTNGPHMIINTDSRSGVQSFVSFVDSQHDPMQINKSTRLVIISDDYINNALESSGIFNERDKGFFHCIRYIWLNSNASSLNGTGSLDFTGSGMYGISTSNRLYVTKTNRDGLVAHNGYNFGNFLWGAATHRLRVPGLVSRIGAHINNFLNDPQSRFHLDSKDDQKSIQIGINWANENNR